MDTPRPLGFWVTLVERMIDQQFASTLDEHGVTRPQWHLLGLLSERSATGDELDAAIAGLGGASPTAAEHLSELVDSGWVLHGEVWELTGRGQTAFSGLHEVVDAQRTLLTDGLEADEERQASAALERVARNLGWSD